MSMGSVRPTKPAALLLILLLVVSNSVACRAIGNSHLVSCTRNDGKCREVNACPENRQSNFKTICLLRRKICCLNHPISHIVLTG